MKLNELLKKCTLKTLKKEVNSQLSSGVEEDELTTAETLSKSDGEARLNILGSNLKLSHSKAYRDLENAYKNCVGMDTENGEQDSTLIMNLYHALDDYSRVRGKVEAFNELING